MQHQHFYKINEINRAFFTNTIASNSVFVRPSSIGSLPDNNEHSVVFQPQSSVGYFCSNPKKIDIIKSEKFIYSLLNDLREEDYLGNRADFIELGREMLVIASEAMGEGWRDFSRGYLSEMPNKPEVVSYFSRLFFNCDFYLLRDK